MTYCFSLLSLFSIFYLSNIYSMGTYKKTLSDMKTYTHLIALEIDSLCSQGKSVKAETVLNRFIADTEKQLACLPLSSPTKTDFKELVTVLREKIKTAIECASIVDETGATIQKINRKFGLLRSYPFEERMNRIASGKPEYTVMSKISNPADVKMRMDEFEAFTKKIKKREERERKEK